ncbi:hypothetical protein MLD38_015219 [Melastoma candidum]|uniref:Uncharacterized protein n=1 Tax=Melastoma candidum TaxID=119954 RepID=A0ACB9RF17_9MYRT|nr:hypothetical protein MLD38_015219 [Melastoma candidum]
MTPFICKRSTKAESNPPFLPPPLPHFSSLLPASLNDKIHLPFQRRRIPPLPSPSRLISSSPISFVASGRRSLRLTAFPAAEQACVY